MLPDDKPMSLSVKDYIIRKMSVKMRINEQAIEAAINHQFKHLNEVMGIYKSVEMSGFGKFLFRDSAAIKKIELYTKMLGHLENKPSTPLNESKKADLMEHISFLKTRIC
jgi:nucleoid DNA-binding protein